MSFEKRFLRALEEGHIDDLKRSYIKGGSNKRHHNAKTGSDRKHQNFIPVVHQVDPSDNHNVEHMRDNAGGHPHILSPQDLVHIINRYIKQGDQEPCTVQNVHDMAAKYLRSGKQLGNSSMMVVYNPLNNTYILKK